MLCSRRAQGLAATGSASPSPTSEQAVGQGVGLLARRSAADDALGRAPQVLDQHDPQRDRHRPELADRERLHALVGAHEAAERLRVEAAVGVRDERPGQAEDARIALEGPFRELGQLAIEAAREIVADLADLLLDDVEVVDQPLGGRRDGAFLADRRADGAIRGEQHPAVVAQPLRQRPTGAGPRRHALGSREALGMLLEALDAEELGADRLFGVPRDGRRPSPPSAAGSTASRVAPNVCQMFHLHTEVGRHGELIV